MQHTEWASSSETKIDLNFFFLMIPNCFRILYACKMRVFNVKCAHDSIDNLCGLFWCVCVCVCEMTNIELLIRNKKYDRIMAMKAINGNVMRNVSWNSHSIKCQVHARPPKEKKKNNKKQHTQQRIKQRRKNMNKKKE